MVHSEAGIQERLGDGLMSADAQDALLGPDSASLQVVNGQALPARLPLSLTVVDPEVVAELLQHEEGPPRERYALTALRIGVLALRHASGQLDVASIQQAGERLVHDIRAFMTERAESVLNELSRILERHLDPQNGNLRQQLDRLLAEDGELARRLEEFVGEDSSILAKTLADHIGQHSPLLQLLSPDNKKGLLEQIRHAVQEALEAQKNTILSAFDLNNQDSALRRLANEVKEQAGQVGEQLKAQVDRLMAEFSSDREGSALQRLQKLLEQTHRQVDHHLSLDQPDSALSRLQEQLHKTLRRLAEDQANFTKEVREVLARLQAREEAEARSPAHGHSFQEALGEWLARRAVACEDQYEDVTATPGKGKAKKGDFVITLGPDSAAPNARVVWEAKDQKGLTLAKLLQELKESREVREAVLGVAVVGAQSAPADLRDRRLVRYGRDVVVVWDPESPAMEVFLDAAYTLSRALVIQQAAASTQWEAAFAYIAEAVREVEEKVKQLAGIEKLAQNVQNAGRDLYKGLESLRQDLADFVRRVNGRLKDFQTSSSAPAAGMAEAAVKDESPF